MSLKGKYRIDPNNFVGDTFNRLTVTGVVRNLGSKSDVTAKCKCGQEGVFKLYRIRSGNTKSCGCLDWERREERFTKHGGSGSKLYQTWKGMKQRCNNPRNQDYERYGGRGIKIEPPWDADFSSFREWAMENGFEEGLSIDRRDVNGNYSPSNCRWVDDTTQARNRGNGWYEDVGGEIKLAVEWCEIFGIHYNTARSRMLRGLKGAEIFEPSDLRKTKVKELCE